MPNKVGSLSQLTALLAASHIDIIGIASEVSAESGLVRIALARNADISSILSRAGFSSVETPILSIEVEENSGYLAKVAEALSEGKVNITTVYGTSVDNSKKVRLLIAVQNIDRACEILEELCRNSKGK